MEIVLFSKMLGRTGDLPVEEIGPVIADLGFDGVDLTVRPGGHVEPPNAATRLPAVVEMLSEVGLSVPLITSDITHADQAHAADIFGAADDAGVDHLKLGYWPYAGFGSLDDGLAAFATDVASIRELSESHAVTPAIHTHSGDFLTANPALLWDVLASTGPSTLGLYVDPGHLVTEGGRSSWEMTLDRVREYVSIVSIKDFAWEQTVTAGESTWRHRWVPIGDGLVPWAEVAACLDAIEFDGPVSLHSEYPVANLDEMIERIEQDFTVLEGIMGRN